MEFLELKDHLLSYFDKDFDHSLINDQNNNPFVQITLIRSSLQNTSYESFGTYLVEPGKPAIHTTFSIVVIVGVLALEGTFLIRSGEFDTIIEEKFGCISGITVGKDLIILVSVISDLDDARFVCRSITNRIRIYCDNP